MLLGGGLATVAAESIKANANTFNAASVNPDTAKDLRASLAGMDNKINAWYLDGDAISMAQDNPIFDVMAAALTPITLATGLVIGQPKLELGYVPEAAGTRHQLTGWIDNKPITSTGSQLLNTFGLHSNTTMLNSLYKVFSSPLQSGAINE